MGLRLLTPPAVEPILLSEAKLHLRVDGATEDSLIAALIVAAREHAQNNRLRRSIMPTSWVLTLDGFPPSIHLPMPRVLTIDSVRYRDAAGTLLVLDPSVYVLDNHDEVRNRLYLAPGNTWPGTQPRHDAVIVTYTAGYASAIAVPAALKQWLLLAIGEMHANREATVTGTTETRLGFADRLLDSYVVPPV